MTTRRFPNTTDDTGNIGKPGHDGERSWNRFVAKYKTPVTDLLTDKYPQYSAEAEDAFFKASERIFDNPAITCRKPNDSFRSVLSNLCVRELLRPYNPHRQAAVKRFCNYLLVKLQPSRLPTDGFQRERILEIIRFIRSDMMDPDYENGRFFKRFNRKKLDLWRQAQRADTTDAELARQLGLPYHEVNRARLSVDKWIVEEAMRTARQLGVLDAD